MAGMYWGDKLGDRAKLNTLFQSTIGAGANLEAFGMKPGSTGMDDKQFQVKVKMGVEFIQVTGKVLFPEACSTAAWATKYKEVMNITNAYTAEISAYQNRDDKY